MEEGSEQPDSALTIRLHDFFLEYVRIRARKEVGVQVSA